MAAAETDAAPVKEVESSPTPTEKHTEKLSKVEKPDEEKYKKDLAEADKQLSSINEKLVFPLAFNLVSSKWIVVLIC